MNEDKLQFLIDRQSIRDTLLRHGACFDEGNIAGLDEIWAPDCRRDDGPGRGTPIVGRDELKKRLTAAVGKFNWTHHQLGDSFIDIDGDKATSVSFVVCWHETVEGEKCWGSARYYDELRRAGERWVITQRRLVMTGAEGAIAAHGGTWLERLDPSLATQ
jgi:hypothetical protein